MKIHIKNLLLVPALIAALTIATGLQAQTFTTLYSFTAAPGSYPYVNSDGANPLAGLILSGNILYGTAANGGSAGRGTVFAINTDGSGFTNLHSCNISSGATPEAGLILSGNTLYGTALTGSPLGHGTIFAIYTNGNGFTNLYSFTGDSTGATPHGVLTLSGTTLYGTTSAGGSVADSGTVFAINTSGIGITNLHKFVAKTDGSSPYAGLVLSGNTLYGTASSGGSGQGTVFRVNADSTSFTNLHNFTYINDGAFPQGDLILSGNTLYGTTANGGIRPRAMARYSPSTPMARVLRTCIVLPRQHSIPMTSPPTAMEPILMPVWF